MKFKCMTCGKTSPDIDMVLNGSCSCGGTRFHLISQEKTSSTQNLSEKEQIRRDLHRWLDINIDSIEPTELCNLRVSFELD